MNRLTKVGAVSTEPAIGGASSQTCRSGDPLGGEASALVRSVRQPQAESINLIHPAD
jgi:hypothetical protein